MPLFKQPYVEQPIPRTAGVRGIEAHGFVAIRLVNIGRDTLYLGRVKPMSNLEILEKR